MSSPDGQLVVNVSCEGGRLYYDATLDGQQMMEKSALGLKTSIGDFTRDLSTVNCQLSTNTYISALPSPAVSAS